MEKGCVFWQLQQKVTIIRRWHFALKSSPSASDIFLFLLVRRPFSATDSNDLGIKISFPLREKCSPVTLGWIRTLAEVKKADEQGQRVECEDARENRSTRVSGFQGPELFCA